MLSSILIFTWHFELSLGGFGGAVSDKTAVVDREKRGFDPGSAAGVTGDTDFIECAVQVGSGPG